MNNKKNIKSVKFEEHLTKPNEDGWELNLIRYKSEKTFENPVILCHGLAANKNSVDFGNINTDEWLKYSLASYLSILEQDRKISFDCWVAQLRGRGKKITFDPEKNPDKYKWCVDDYIEKDVPSIINYVQNWYLINRKHKPKIFWIGKSMGGMIGYAYAQTDEGKKNLKGLITIGSPMAFEYNSILLEPIARLAPRNISFPINVSEILQKKKIYMDAFKKAAANQENIDSKILKKYIDIGMNNTISSKVLNQFLLFYRHNNFCKYPKNPWLFDFVGKTPLLKKISPIYSYKKNIYRIETPLLAIAGNDDKAADPREVRFCSRNVNSQDVTYINFCKKDGYSKDYGHLDLNLGLNVKNEVYNYIYNWLKLRSE
jgi:pimeloyl-ACP methyl ester carboxylesterase